MSSTREALRLTSQDTLVQAAECLRTLSHPHRLRMVQMLLQARFNVGELAEACSIPNHMASEHLRLMQRCGLLGSEREGHETFYSVAEPHLPNILACIEGRFGIDEARYAFPFFWPQLSSGSDKTRYRFPLPWGEGRSNAN